LLGAYTRAEDDAMTLAFEGRGKKRLNRVFDIIGFVSQITAIPRESIERKEKLLLRPFLLRRRVRRLRF
jgi:hypothetical protein